MIAIKNLIRINQTLIISTSGGRVLTACRLPTRSTFFIHGMQSQAIRETR